MKPGVRPSLPLPFLFLKGAFYAKANLSVGAALVVTAVLITPQFGAGAIGDEGSTPANTCWTMELKRCYPNRKCKNLSAFDCGGRGSDTDKLYVEAKQVTEGGETPLRFKETQCDVTWECEIYYIENDDRPYCRNLAGSSLPLAPKMYSRIDRFTQGCVASAEPVAAAAAASGN